MDGKQIYIFGNRAHRCERWEGKFSKELPPINLGEWFPGEMKVHVRYYQHFTVAQSLN